MNKGDDVKPYLLPPLGRHYIETWAEEEQATVPSRGRSNSPARREGSVEVSKSNHHAESSSSISNKETTLKTGGKAGTTTATATTGKGEGEKEAKEEEQKPEPIPERARYLKSTEPLTDDYLMMEDLSCGGLTERLLSTLVIEDMVDLTELKNLALLDDSTGEGTTREDDDDDDDMDLDSVSSSEGGRTVVELSNNPTEEIVDFEERLKRELRYAGLFGDEDVWF